MEELCSKLKEKRKKLDYTIEEVVEKTKLHPSVIRDIEEGNLDTLNPVYLKGFIKIYASFLGVDIKEDLKKLPVTSPPQRRAPSRKKIRKSLSPEAKRLIILAAAAAAALIVFVGIVRLAARKISSAKKPPKREAKTGILKPPAPRPSLRPVAASLTAKRRCFLKVKVDGKVLFEGVLEKGAVETWEADKEIEFGISDGSAVSLEVNGAVLPPLTSLHKSIKSLKITPSGISVDK